MGGQLGRMTKGRLDAVDQLVDGRPIRFARRLGRSDYGNREISATATAPSSARQRQVHIP